MRLLKINEYINEGSDIVSHEAIKKILNEYFSRKFPKLKLNNRKTKKSDVTRVKGINMADGDTIDIIVRLDHNSITLGAKNSSGKELAFSTWLASQKMVDQLEDKLDKFIQRAVDGELKF